VKKNDDSPTGTSFGGLSFQLTLFVASLGPLKTYIMYYLPVRRRAQVLVAS
jgi:hypothetical protein